MGVSVEEGLASILKEGEGQLLGYFFVRHAKHQYTVLVSVMEKVFLQFKSLAGVRLDLGEQLHRDHLEVTRV